MSTPIHTVISAFLLASIASVSLLAGVSSARADVADVQGLHASLGGMGLANSQSQGGKGPSGSSVLTQLEAFWSIPWVAAGAFLQFDKQGGNETDFGLGPKMEVHYGPFFLESGYAFTFSQSYNDRAIQKRSGKAAYFGGGVRMVFTKFADQGGLFIQVSYKFRTISLTEQDGRTISEPITQHDTYPLISLGYVF